jgi:hypothetical protein
MDKTQTQRKPGWLREQMPKVAGMVDQRRKEWGSEHCNACITAALSGQPNHFYAFEGGQIIGTPFTPETAVMPEAEVLRLAMLSGSAFMVMREPKVVPNGQNPVR